MKFIIILLFFGLSLQAQESKSFIIEGKVAKTLTVDLVSLKAYKEISLDSLVIFNHLMQRKSTIKNIKGVLLKDILANVEIVTDSPKKLSEYYIVCMAADHYKVVYSWNEIFNSPTGNHTLVLTQFGANKKESENIALITPTDAATGRRFVKGLSKITILQVN